MERKRFSLELSEGLLNKIDQFKREWGLRSRGAIVERLLQELLINGECEVEADQNNRIQLSKGQVDENLSDFGRSRNRITPKPSNSQPRIEGLDDSDFNECGALVLVAREAGGGLALDFESISYDVNSAVPEVSSRNGGIDLPGFVQKKSAQIKRSITANHESSARHQEPLPTVPVELLNQGLERAKNHWLELYGTPANEAVLEAAMVWLAKDIWPQCDQSEGRIFTWSLACSVIEAFAPTWPSGAASFEKVMVMAGLLEDPFSTSTLQLRLPTLIRRFVHRFRTRKRGTSFQALEHTMTLHGALKLLQLPTSPGHRLSLPEIREAYRDIALTTHPDSGGSEEEMRKVNEAYQLLKELYRNG